ncbi:membrane protein, partial [Pseudomonas syringae pv. actinidiae ICMP 19079]
TAAAELSQRQLWWIGTAASTAAGLALLVFGQNWLLKVLGAFAADQRAVLGSTGPDQRLAVSQKRCPPKQCLTASGQSTRASAPARLWWLG